jgi:hypothetical protein
MNAFRAQHRKTCLCFNIDLISICLLFFAIFGFQYVECKRRLRSRYHARTFLSSSLLLCFLPIQPNSEMCVLEARRRRLGSRSRGRKRGEIRHQAAFFFNPLTPLAAAATAAEKVGRALLPSFQNCQQQQQPAMRPTQTQPAPSAQHG